MSLRGDPPPGGAAGAGEGRSEAVRPGLVSGLDSTLSLTVLFAGVLVSFSSLTLIALGRTSAAWLAVAAGTVLLALGVGALLRTCRER